MSHQIESLDQWIRGDFTQLNTELEKSYRTEQSPSGAVSPPVSREVRELRSRLLNEGHRRVADIGGLAVLPKSDTERLDLLGNVGLFMAACSRHGLNEPHRNCSPLIEESELANRLGGSLDVAPRFILAPYATHNRARKGAFKSFTRLKDELLFIEYNSLGIFAYQRAAAALLAVSNVGISSPVAPVLLEQAGTALEDVRHGNDRLFRDLDIETFFRSIRPYYLPSFVGNREFRGVNAGDFAGINQIDLLLGLCSGEDSFYARLIDEKQPYILPDERHGIEDALARTSLLDELLEDVQSSSRETWFRTAVRAFLDVCRKHGRAAATHQNKLVERFIVRPAAQLREDQRTRLTASGPPLDVLIEMLEKLRDLRLAKPRNDIASRHTEIETLRQSIAT